MFGKVWRWETVHEVTMKKPSPSKSQEKQTRRMTEIEQEEFEKGRDGKDFKVVRRLKGCRARYIGEAP